MRILHIMAVAVLVAMAAGSGFSEEDKIAVVDMRAVLSAHPEMAAAETVIKDKLKEFAAEKDDYQEQLAKMGEDLEKAHMESENKALSDEAKKMKKTLVDEKLDEMKQFQARTKEALKIRRDQIEEQGLRMQKKIVDTISSAVEAYAKKKGISAVFNKQVLVYNDDAIDITNEIMELVVKKTKSE